MANHKSALKRIRQSEKRRQTNRVHRGAMRTEVKKFRAAIEAGDKEAAATALAAAVARTAATGSKGVLHKNTASRRISRLQLAFNRAFAS
jgi:small subunit ribosomal protein S20